MTDFLQDQAALYALSVLDPEEARALEQHMASDPALATLVRELQDTVAETTRALPPEAPPSELRAPRPGPDSPAQGPTHSQSSACHQPSLLGTSGLGARRCFGRVRCLALH
jgi:anti-sigma factor RsiW